LKIEYFKYFIVLFFINIKFPSSTNLKRSIRNTSSAGKFNRQDSINLQSSILFGEGSLK